MKNIYVLILLITFSNICLADSGNFIIKIEIGPNSVNYGELPKTILREDLNQSTGSLTSFWLSFGYSYRNIVFLPQIGLAGTGDIKNITNENPINIARINFASITSSINLIKFKNLLLWGTGGYQYTYFNSYPTNDKTMNYRYEDSNLMAGLKTELYLRHYDNENNNDINWFDEIIGDISYEYTNTAHPLKEIKLIIKGSTNKRNGYLIFRCSYISQLDVYDMFVFTIGVYGCFGF